MDAPTQAQRTDAPPRAAARRGAHLQLVDGFASRLSPAWDTEALVEWRIRRGRGEVVVSPEQPFAGLVLVRFGSCKSAITATHGLEQITAYHIAGDILGAEALCAGTKQSTVTALEESEFWLIPFARLEAAANDDPSLRRCLCTILSQQILRDREAIVMLGTMRSEQRLAAFLLDLGARYGANGYSSCEFVLRLTREEIGLHLGLSVETVSRLFTRIHQDGLVQVRGRTIKLVDRDGLVALRDVRP